MNSRIKKYMDNDLNNPKSGSTLDLSAEKLTYKDYKYLAKIIKNTGFLENLKLPCLSKENAEDVLFILNQATAINTTLTNLEINLPFKKDIPKNIKFHQQQIQLRINRNKKRIFAIHGGGNIGLGLMADVVSQSPFEYKVIATSNDKFLNNLINSTHQLWLQHGTSTNIKVTRVKNVSMISREEKDIEQLYVSANILAICLTPGVLASSAKNIAKGLLARYKKDGSGLKILVLMNIPKCEQFVQEKVSKELLLLTDSPDEVATILSKIQFIPTVVDRIVNKITFDVLKKQLKRQLVSCMSYDFIDGAKTLSKQVDIILESPDKLSEAIAKFNLKFNLYNAEDNFALYIPKTLPESLRFPAAQAVKDLGQLEAIKNKYINGPHAIIAWLGALLGYTTIAEAINHPGMIQLIEKMMEKEIGPVLRTAYPDISVDELEFLKNLFFERCKASMDDTVVRVGRDPMRKLDTGGRIRGTIELCQMHNLEIPTPSLEMGVAAAILYAVKRIDPENPGCKRILEIYEQNEKSYEAVLCYKGPAPNGNYSGLDPDRDRILIDSILNHITLLEHYYEKQQEKPFSSTDLYSPKKSMGKLFDVSYHEKKDVLSIHSLFSRKSINESKFSAKLLPHEKSDSMQHKYLVTKKN